MSAFDSWEVARRARGANLVIFALFGVIAAAFFKAQVLDHEQYRTQSNSNRLRQIAIPAPRGEILDRSGRLIVENVPGYSIRLLASREDSLRAVLGRLAAFIPRDTIDVDAVVRRWSAAKYQPALVMASGEFSTVAALEERRAALPGLIIQREPHRRYADGVAHLVGYVSEINEKELEDGKFPAARMGELVGKLGIEEGYDSTLRGQQGVRYAEVTAGGRTVREQVTSGSIAPVAGKMLRTTIDLPLQQFIDSMWRTDLPNRRGAMVAMAPDGAILAYYSAPGYDPNRFGETYRGLQGDPNLPLINRVIQGRYPPASPFKLAIAAMALRRGLVTMDTRMRQPCNGAFQFGNRIAKCWKHSPGHGSLTLREAIASSCDVYFYQLGLLLGEDAIFADGNEMGFGDRTGIDLEQEARPVFPTSLRSYINSRGVQTWGKGEVLNLAIGQGRNAQTLINMVSFYAALAGDGIKREPYLITRPPQTTERDLRLTSEQLRDLRSALVNVVKSGTAAASGGQQFNVAGKTGSGQVTGTKDIAWFIGFAPADSASIVAGIQVEEGEHGATVAKYVVRAIAKYITGRAVKADVATVTEDLAAPPSDTGGGAGQRIRP